MTIELLSRGVSIVAFDSDGLDAQALLAPYGIACVATPDPARVNVFLHPHGNTLAVCSSDGMVVALVRRPLDREELLVAIESAARVASLQREAQAAAELLHIARMLSAEPNLPALQRLILQKARELTKADAGTLLLIEDRGGMRALRVAVAQTGANDVGTHADAFLPLVATSIAGCVALTGETLRIPDAYRLDHGSVRFDDSFDKRTGYRTKSVLCVPMRNYRDEIVGVIQLINRKPEFEFMLTSAQHALTIVEPFDEYDEQIALGLAAQAGVALGVLRENRLYEA